MTELTVKEFAALERVHELTVRRWIREGTIEVRRTPGGQIRIADRRQTTRLVVLTTDDAA